MIMRAYWKHNVAEDMQVVEYTAEQKSDVSQCHCLPPSSLNVTRRSCRCFHARSSFFECGLFPSRASISVIVWGVIWDKIWEEEREKTTLISLKYCSGCWRIAGNSFNWGWDRSISKNVPEGHPGSQAAGQWWKHPGGLSWPPHCADTRLQDREKNNHWEPGAKTHNVL